MNSVCFGSRPKLLTSHLWALFQNSRFLSGYNSRVRRLKVSPDAPLSGQGGSQCFVNDLFQPDRQRHLPVGNSPVMMSERKCLPDRGPSCVRRHQRPGFEIHKNSGWSLLTSLSVRVSVCLHVREVQQIQRTIQFHFLFCGEYDFPCCHFYFSSN